MNVRIKGNFNIQDLKLITLEYMQNIILEAIEELNACVVQE